MDHPPESPLHITLEADEASDSWGFVGRVMIGDHESYRTIRAFPTPSEAITATQVIVGEVLGALLAGQEWRSLSDELGRAPRREDLNFGLSSSQRRWKADLPPGTDGA
ncbi:hypothetical protein [Nocardioides sp.]|uniref:hypothetical protein n=1 Tax=Nocardioides sp. TaxID=35761 RepID=UPI003D106680